MTVGWSWPRIVVVMPIKDPLARVIDTTPIDPGPHERHNFPEVVASEGLGGHYFREIVPILGAARLEIVPLMGAARRAQ
jgi:hypothetical protein